MRSSSAATAKLPGRRLRIAHVVRSDAFAGVERSIVLSAAALTSRGHQVTVIGGLEQFIQPALVGHGAAWLPATTTAAVFSQLVRILPVDVVHAHMTAAEAATVLARLRTRFAMVTTRHFASARGTSHGARILAKVIERTPRVEIAISDYVANAIGGAPLLIPHGTPDAHRIDPVGRRVVMIQRLESEKCTAVGLVAFARSGLAEQGWSLEIAGDGTERGMLEHLALELGIDQSVRLHGLVRDVPAFRRGASIHLATCPKETFGLAVLESMAVGLPVLSAASGAPPYLLGGMRELLFRPGDATEAACHLVHLASDLDRRRRVGEQLQRRQRTEFSLDAHGSALEAAYLKAVAQR